MDDEIKQQLLDSFNDAYEDVEICLADIQKQPTSEMLNHLFRSIHSAKGNAAMMGLDNIVAYAHAIEELAGSVRAKRFPCTSAVAEIIQTCMDRLKDMHYRDLLGKSFDNLKEEETIALLESLSRVNEAELESASSKVLGFLGAGIAVPNVSPQAPLADNTISITIDDEKLQSDLIFFQEMAIQVDSQSQYWAGRSIQLFDWAMKVNHIGGKPVPYEQFAAAIYLHDIGMSYLPKELIDKDTTFTENELRMLKQHPRWGFELLNRIPGWDEAAQIVLDHHEWVNGQGYPNGKLGASIHPGAKIISILDAFFSITRGRADRDRRKTVIRAISEINSGIDSQFDGTWVQCFNAMVRQEHQAGFL